MWTPRRHVPPGRHLEGEPSLSAASAVLWCGFPVAVFVLGVLAMYAYLTRTVDAFHAWLVAGTAALLVLPVVLAAAGASMAWCPLALARLQPVGGEG